MSRACIVVVLIVLPTLALADDKPVVVKLSGLSAEAPAEWKAEKPANRLRSYQFKLPSGDKEFADAELAVFPESSPKAADAFAKWKATFTPPDGKTLDDVAKTTQFEVGKATAHVLDVTGTWKFKERPNDPKSKEEIRPEYRAVWVVLVTPDETTHLRLSGPQGVVEKHFAGFERWLKSLK